MLTLVITVQLNLDSRPIGNPLRFNQRESRSNWEENRELEHSPSGQTHIDFGDSLRRGNGRIWVSH